MTPRTYSSVLAFVEHWRALREAVGSLSPQDQELLAAMERVVDALHSREYAALLDAAAGSDGARRRDRAEYQLSRLLTAAGWLQS